MGVRNHLVFLKKFFGIELASAMEYRFNFIAQSFGMFLNNLIWIFFWYILFQKFESMNGWSFHDMALLYAIVTISFGLTGVFFGQVRRIATMIEGGALDYFITLPKNVLLHSIAKLRYPATGDLFFGIFISLFILSWSQVPLFILLVICGAVFFLNYAIIFGSIAFFTGRFEAGARTANETLIIFSTYPYSVFSGFSKFLLLFVIPAGFISGVPVELLKSFNLEWFIILIGFMIASSAFAIWLFYKGLRRYESGNTIALRG